MRKKTDLSEISINERVASTFAQTRIERIIGRVFSLAALVTTLETFANAVSQTVYVDSTTLFVSIGLLLAAQLSAVYSFWIGSARRWVYLLHGAAYVIAFFIYPLSVKAGVEFPSDFRPWLWWATGTASMAMGMFLTKWWSFGYLAFMPLSWFFLRIQTIGGSGSIGSGILDAAYIVLFSATILTLVGLLKAAARRLDLKNDEAVQLSVRRAEAEATSLERQKLDDLIHDQVLTTLILAANAENAEQQKLAAESAENAVSRINDASTGENELSQEISISAYLEALAATIKRGFPNCPINLTKLADFSIPISVAIAFSEATIQALTNSLQHAGRKATRQVRLKAERNGVKIVIKDDGRGFWLSRIPKDRFGVRNSIFRRMERAGGVANIATAPRKGTTVILRWHNNA